MKPNCCHTPSPLVVNPIQRTDRTVLESREVPAQIQRVEIQVPAEGAHLPPGCGQRMRLEPAGSYFATCGQARDRWVPDDRVPEGTELAPLSVTVARTRDGEASQTLVWVRGTQDLDAVGSVGSTRGNKLTIERGNRRFTFELAADHGRVTTEVRPFAMASWVKFGTQGFRLGEAEEGRVTLTEPKVETAQRQRGANEIASLRQDQIEAFLRNSPEARNHQFWRAGGQAFWVPNDPRYPGQYIMPDSSSETAEHAAQRLYQSQRAACEQRRRLAEAQAESDAMRRRDAAELQQKFDQYTSCCAPKSDRAAFLDVYDAQSGYFTWTAIKDEVERTIAKYRAMRVTQARRDVGQTSPHGCRTRRVA